MVALWGLEVNKVNIFPEIRTKRGIFFFEVSSKFVLELTFSPYLELCIL